MTPLIWAAYKGHTDIANLLINKDADINAKNNVSVVDIIIYFYLHFNNI